MNAGLRIARMEESVSVICLEKRLASALQNGQETTADTVGMNVYKGHHAVMVEHVQTWLLVTTVHVLQNGQGNIARLCESDSLL